MSGLQPSAGALRTWGVVEKKAEARVGRPPIANEIARPFRPITAS
jgi:hypothetical protein